MRSAIGDERLDPITRSHLRRRLRRRSIHEDVAAVAQPRRERTGLHEAHRAQPTIDTRLFGCEGSRHASKDGMARMREGGALRCVAGPLSTARPQACHDSVSTPAATSASCAAVNACRPAGAPQ